MNIAEELTALSNRLHARARRADEWSATSIAKGLHVEARGYRRVAAAYRGAAHEVEALRDLERARVNA